MDKELHQSTVLLDAHCDTLLKLHQHKKSLGDNLTNGHIDLGKLKAGGVNVQFFAIFIDPDYGEARGCQRALELIDVYYQQCDQYQDQIVPATSSNDIRLAVQNKQIATVLAIEGGEALGGKLHMLRIYHLLGVRCLTLTWNGRNSIADGVGEGQTKSGLTKFGQSVVKEMNHLGMIIDVSHISETGFWDVVKLTHQPLVATHSNCAALCQHPRNLTDQQIKAIAATNGVIGITLVPQFVSPEKPTIESYIDHIDHVANLLGNTKHIGIGTDFDGVDKTIPEIYDCSMLPLIAEKLLHRGYSKDDINNILSGNFLRVFSDVVG
ncbi:dipeptidase [Peptococcaceae bacterium 1198_IL3148]